MKARSFFWGVIFVLFGILLLLKNFDYIDFNWTALFRYWPVILIMLGISILPMKSLIKYVLVIILAIGTMISIPFTRPLFDYPFGFNFHSLRIDSDDYYSDKFDDQVYTIPKKDDIKTGRLDLNALAGDFKLEGTDLDLLNFEKSPSHIQYDISTEVINEDISVEIKPERGRIYSNNNENLINLQIDKSIKWDIDIDAAASKCELNLQGNMIRNLFVDGGATDIEIKLGDLMKETKVNLNSAAAKIVVYIPESSGCKIKTSSILSKKQFDDFEKVSTGVYKSDNFDNSENKVYINFDAAISKIKIKRY
ncbi:MAG: LiaI-LiaF-like domain-containing protein [Hyphomicrobiales bacterium]